MKQGAKYRIFHYDIFVLLTVVLVVIGIHVVDGLRIYPESYQTRSSYAYSNVSELKDRLELRSGYSYDVLTSFSLRYSSYIYNPDSVYKFCEILGSELERIEMVAVIPSPTLYQGRDFFIPAFSRRISKHAFDGSNIDYVKTLYQLYQWDKVHIRPNNSLDLLSDPYTIEIDGQLHHISLLCFPIMGTGDVVDATVVAALSIDNLSSYIDSINKFANSKFYIVSDSKKFIINPDRSMIGCDVGTFFEDTYGNVAKEIIDSACQDIVPIFSRIDNGNILFATGNSSEYWTMFYAVPYNDVFMSISNDVIYVSIVALFGVVIIILVCAFNIKRASDHRAVQSAIERDLEIAANIQTSFLQKPLLTLPSVDIDVRQRPAKTVGGDLYYCNQDGNKLVLCIGDVTGKGVPAALLMSSVVTMLDVFAKAHKSPSEICSLINDNLSSNNPDFHFVTLFVGVLDTDTGVLKYCNAGHNEPIYEGRFLNTSKHMPLGAEANQIFSEDEIVLAGGSFFILYTDGVTEAMGPQSKMYGENRFLSSVNTAAKETSKDLNEYIFGELRKFVQKREQNDDITLFTLRFSRK